MKVLQFAGLTCLLALLPFSLGAEDCLKEHNVTTSQVEAVLPSTPISGVPSNIKCYSRCVINEYLDSGGKINLELVGNRSSEQEQRILGECKTRLEDVSDMETCDYSYLMLQCLFLAKSNGTETS